MNKTVVISKAEDFAREKMKDYDAGHDWWHIFRVRGIAKYINSIEESADPFTLDIAAILHDVADSKFKSGDVYNNIETFLSANGLNDIRDKVLNAVKNISFSRKDPKGDLADPVLLILQDADRLDAIGAIGVARAFSYGSHKRNNFYEPSDFPGGKPGTTIHHFYEKLLKLKGLMNTATGKELAEERHRFLEIFLEQFYSEWRI